MRLTDQDQAGKMLQMQMMSVLSYGFELYKPQTPLPVNYALFHDCLCYTINMQAIKHVQL